jgi:signal transduction histidine kinase
MKQMNAVGRLATLGLIIVLLALMGLAFWTTGMTLKLSGAVKEAVYVNTLLEQAHYDLSTEESLEREYRLQPSLDIRRQHQAAATALVKHLQAASSNAVGEPQEDKELVADVLREHRRYLLAAAQLFADVDARDTVRRRILEQTTIGPLFQQMQQQVNVLNNKYSQEAIQRLTELDQTQHKIFTTTPIVLVIGLGLLGLCWAVLGTYRRKLDEAKQAELAQLQETARLKTLQVEEQRQLNQLKDHILLHVSHELRTPLTSVAGYVELLQEHQGKVDTQMLARWVDGVKQGSDQLEQLINSILDAALVAHDGQNLKLKPTPVAPMVRKILASFDPREVQAYAIRLDLPEHLTVWADQLALQRVLRNVLGNAFKYAPKQTPLSIRAALCRHSSGSADEYACICVQDAGPGIPPDEVPLLFQKFVRLKRDLAGTERGSGLGLYISRQLVEAMHGQMWVESSGRPGEGSSFYFTLPSAAQPAREERPTTVDVLVQDGPSRSLNGSNHIEPSVR